MSFQEKRTITTIATGAAVLAAYCLYAFGKFQSGAVAQDDLKFWAVTMLVFIGIGVVATIVIQIVFHILTSIAIAIREKMKNMDCDEQGIEKSIGAELVEDERDKLIGLKSTRFGFYLSGFGFVLALVALVMGFSQVVMLNMMYVSFSAGSIVEGIAQLVLYRRG